MHEVAREQVRETLRRIVQARWTRDFITAAAIINATKFSL